jgi:hypothetical protein
MDKLVHESNDKCYNNITPKSQILISFSGRKDDYYYKHMVHKECGKTKKWNTYTISRDGIVSVHYDPKYYSDFTGNNIVDMSSISIVLENMGPLSLVNDHYLNFLNEECDEINEINKKFIRYDYYEKIYDKQMHSLADLCLILCDKFDIPIKCLEFQYYNKSINKFNGILFTSNYNEDSGGVNPTFDIAKFSEMLEN